MHCRWKWCPHLSMTFGFSAREEGRAKGEFEGTAGGQARQAVPSPAAGLQPPRRPCCMQCQQLGTAVRAARGLAAHTHELPAAPWKPPTAQHLGNSPPSRWSTCRRHPTVTALQQFGVARRCRLRRQPQLPRAGTTWPGVQMHARHGTQRADRPRQRYRAALHPCRRGIALTLRPCQHQSPPLACARTRLALLRFAAGALRL